MSDSATAHRTVIDHLRAPMYDWDGGGLAAAIGECFAPDAVMQLAFPFETLDGPAAWQGRALDPLAAAWPDLERRDTIVVSGRTGEDHDWVGCCGFYTGTSVAPWLDIPATGRAVAMRFHEFFRFEDGRIVEMQALWDIPQVMMQAGVWPMGPSLGREWPVPGPATADGLVPETDPQRTQRSLARVNEMLADMGRHPGEPVEVMRLEHHWHPRFFWYGPSGIGTTRGVRGFRAGHQIPFLKAMPDRRGGYDGQGHFFAQGDYVAVTGWPGMSMHLSGDGWLGMAPTGTALTMRSLDFWRVEDDRIRENWVLIDLLSIWDQLGVDVLGRMRELAASQGRTP